MRVLIDTTYARRRPYSGTGVYIAKLCEALQSTGEIDLVTVANEHRRPPAGGGLGSVSNALADEYWASVELAKRARRARADLIHHPLPARSLATRIPQVVTVHDLAFARLPHDFAPAFRAYGMLIHRWAASKAAAIIAVSQATADDLQQLWGIAGPRVHVAPHGPGQDLPHPPRDPRHFLYVGDDEPRKDLATLVAAHALYEERGGRVPLVRSPPQATVEQLAELYAQAVALVHPARHEGFGLTILEAIRAGVPVIAASSPAVVELTRDTTAALFEPGDVEALARSLADPPAPPDPAAASRHSWARSAERHLAAYSWALGHR